MLKLNVQSQLLLRWELRIFRLFLQASVYFRQFKAFLLAFIHMNLPVIVP